MVRKGLAFLLGFVLIFSAFAFQPGAASAGSTADEVISAGKSVMGTPYKYGGTSTSGFDCSGFTRYAFKQAGVDLPRSSSQQYGEGNSVSKSNLKKGDLVFFNTSGSGVSHNGIYIGGGDFIHSSSSKGVSIASVDDPYYWGSKYIGAKRVIDDSSSSGSSSDSGVKSEEYEPLPDGEYHDVKSSFWAYDSITDLGKDGIVKGYSDDRFRPNKKISRAQTATMLARAFDLDTSSTSSEYSDVSSGNEHAGAIKAVSDAGLFTGDDGKFMPNEKLSRQHMALILYRAFDLEGQSSSESFSDVGEGHQYHSEIQALAGAGITTGSDGAFNPEDETTRAHFSVFLDRALD
ncbi:NlpC/P60 family protein [Alteribacillus sp. HJP-4]|uniref:C40 family peptidase n=1 Tax=Alteribacillus sp. HJP-4 TaxID=2775394 RepID=UPI0035CCDD7C